MVVSIKKNCVYHYLGIGNLIVKRKYSKEGPTSLKNACLQIQI